MSNVVSMRNKNNPPDTSDAATGRQLAVDAVMKRDELGSDNAAAIRAAEWLADCAKDSSYQENKALLAGFIAEFFDFLPNGD